MTARRLILASTSCYRAELLARLALPFETCASGVDETPLEGETPAALATRLAAAKACGVAETHPDAVILGSDQVAELDGRAIGKPHDLPRARAQLAAASGRTVTFHTALCLVDACAPRRHSALDTTRVVFRTLSDAEIARYLAAEQPFDCAGSFKCEGLGISLFERIESEDPTALIGLPLIATARLLRACGIALP